MYFLHGEKDDLIEKDASYKFVKRRGPTQIGTRVVIRGSGNLAYGAGIEAYGLFDGFRNDKDVSSQQLHLGSKSFSCHPSLEWIFIGMNLEKCGFVPISSERSLGHESRGD